jgi:hypothetical protein
MRTIQKIAAGAFAISALTAIAVPASAQGPTATGTGTGSVSVVQPITISNTTGLVFGRFSQPSTTGTVAIAAVSTANPTATITGAGVHTVGAQTTSAAAFMVSGDGGSAFAVTPDTGFTMASGGNSISVTTSSSVPSTSLSSSTGTTGTAPFYIGGTMSLASGQAAGAYTGTFHVVVNYN